MLGGRSPRPCRTPRSSRPHRCRSDRPDRADDQIVEAVAVDVARRRDRDAAEVVRRRAAEPEAVAAVEAREIDVGGEARCLAEHHVAGARGRCRADRHWAPRRSGRRSRRRSRRPPTRPTMPLPSRSRHAAQLEAVAAVEAGQREVGAEARRPCRTPRSSRLMPPFASAQRRADDQVVEAVAVHVARRRDRMRPPRSVAARRRSAEAVAAVQARQIEVGGKARRLAEHHVASRRYVLPLRIGRWRR